MVFMYFVLDQIRGIKKIHWLICVSSEVMSEKMDFVIIDLALSDSKFSEFEFEADLWMTKNRELSSRILWSWWFSHHSHHFYGGSSHYIQNKYSFFTELGEKLKLIKP